MRLVLCLFVLAACDEAPPPEEDCEQVEGCIPMECGNGEVEGSEECDEDSGFCNTDCTLVDLCGDGVFDEQSEECDDGNTADGDGCSALCRTEEVGVLCESFAPITCEQGVMGRPDDPGSTTQIAEYNCSSNTFAGAEFVYELIAPAAGPVQLLADLGGNAFVIDGEEDCGQPASCVAHIGANQFIAVAGHRYLVVVEPLPNSGPYFVTLRCN